LQSNLSPQDEKFRVSDGYTVILFGSGKRIPAASLLIKPLTLTTDSGLRIEIIR
jgi:hypothetical protein